MTQSLQETYTQQGYVVLRGLLDAQEVAALREEVDRAVLGRVGPILFEEDSPATGAAVPAAYRDGNRVFRRLNRVIDRGGTFQQIATGKLAQAVRSILGAQAVWACLNRHNMLMLKAPFNPAPVLWHQDAAVWDEGTYQHVTAIVAVDDFRADNGALQVLPGSHRYGPIGLGWEENVKQISEKWGEAIRTGAITADLRAGDALLMHGLLLHGSPGNQTAQTRRSLTIAYYPGDLRKVSKREAVEVVEV